MAPSQLAEIDGKLYAKICAAQEEGEPIEIAHPLYEKNVKKAFPGMRVHESVLCESLKRLHATGMIRIENAGRTNEAYASGRPRVYPVDRLLANI